MAEQLRSYSSSSSLSCSADGYVGYLVLQLAARAPERITESCQRMLENVSDQLYPSPRTTSALLWAIHRAGDDSTTDFLFDWMARRSRMFDVDEGDRNLACVMELLRRRSLEWSNPDAFSVEEMMSEAQFCKEVIARHSRRERWVRALTAMQYKVDDADQRVRLEESLRFIRFVSTHYGENEGYDPIIADARRLSRVDWRGRSRVDSHSRSLGHHASGQ